MVTYQHQNTYVYSVNTYIYSLISTTTLMFILILTIIVNIINLFIQIYFVTQCLHIIHIQR